jgi:transcription elongation factor GreA
MNLVTLATEESWQEFDDAWAKLMSTEEPLDELLEALAVVGHKRRMARCMALIRDHCEVLVASGRRGDAAELLGAALAGGGAPGELAASLYENARAAWGEEPWWGAFCETAGFHKDAPDIRRAWTYLRDMKRYRAGLVVFHAAGWGTGEVTDVSREELEVQVSFQSGRKDRFPLRTAVEIFEILPESDLRVQVLRDFDALKKRIKEDPLEVLRSLLIRFGGKASNLALRNAMMQIGVTGNAWSSWWRRTRLLAENSEWFRVTGNATRAEIELLRRAIDPVDGLRAQLRNAPSLKDALARVRDLLGNTKLEESVRAAALTALAELAAQADQPIEHRLATWMLLREHSGTTPATLLELLQAALKKPRPADPATPPAIWALLAQIPGVREQERSLELLPEVFGEEAWIEEAVRNLPHASPGLGPVLIDRLLKAGRGEDLARHYASLLARPLRSPFVLIHLAKLAEAGKFQGEFPTPAQRAQALTELAVYLEGAKRGNAQLARAQEKLTALLTSGKQPLLRTLLKDADADALRNFRAMMQRGIDDKIDILVTDICLEYGPELFASEAPPFWKEDVIWTTRAALDRRREELRVLREVKLPENAEALARAAGYGDLSENAEWEQAIEQQRQLTEQAKAIEIELSKAALLETPTLPEDTVCPGTEVGYREVATGVERTMVLLGPWDAGTRDNVVSYRAPLAAGMLGLHTGDRAQIQLPGGKVEIEVLSIQPTKLT